MQNKPLDRHLLKVFGYSALAHLVILVIVAVVATATASQPEPRDVVITKLVRLGKKRPKHLLPRKQRAARPTPPPKKKAAVKQSVQPKQAPKPPKKRDTRDTRDALDQMRQQAQVASVLDRLKENDDTNDDEPEGDPEGSLAGTTSDLSLAIIGNKYMNEVYACIHGNYHIEGLNAGSKSLRNKEVTMLVHVNAAGKITGHVIEQSSGVTAFDRSVEKAVRRCGKVSPPPNELRDQLVEHGIEIVFKPT